MNLTAAATGEITRTFNSLTSSTATVAEYISYEFPGSTEWRGDACGCTDDRCTGHHHSAEERCGCLDAQLDQFHNDLAVMYRIRQWQQEQSDPESVTNALTEFSKNSHELNAEQQQILGGLFRSADYLEPADFSAALRRLKLE